MTETPHSETPPSETPLRRGWTTGACATAATRAALMRLWTGIWPDPVSIILPKGETPVFALAHKAEGAGWAEAGIIKDAGDDPDVTHGALVTARVTASAGGVTFAAGAGVGIVTKPGLPLPVGAPAINPVPRKMMEEVVAEIAAHEGRAPDIAITISIKNGAELAEKTWNPRLGIKGGLSVLGTTGIVRPFSCAAWIASIQRGIDVARAEGLTHVAGCTGATSEATVQALHGLSERAMIDMGDFAGGMLRYLRRHPVARVSIGGGLGKLTKLAQGAADLHSARSQVDFALLAKWMDQPRLSQCKTVLETYELAGPPLAQIIAARALEAAERLMQPNEPVTFDIVVIDRAGAVLAQAGP